MSTERVAGPWQVQAKTHKGRSGRVRSTYTVEHRDTGSLVLEGYGDEPKVWRRRAEAQQFADLVNAGAEA